MAKWRLVFGRYAGDFGESAPNEDSILALAWTISTTLPEGVKAAAKQAEALAVKQFLKFDGLLHRGCRPSK